MKSSQQKLSIRIPEAYSRIIKDTIEESQLKALIACVEPLYNENAMTFFNEYTDHSNIHVQEVIDASITIMDEESLGLTTSRNVLVLISSILLHDIGMQLSYEGFRLLISGCFDDCKVSYFDSKTWRELWHDYQLEAKKFDEKSIRSVFGDNLKENFSIPNIDIDNTEFDDLNGYDKKLIGEFIRRNHARFSHEVALKGFPASELIDLLNGISASIRDIIGLISRSHNLNIRDTFAYLKDIDSTVWFSLYDINIIYLMIVIRLSDLIQVHPERASASRLKFKSLSNPISIGEWSLHQTVDTVSGLSDDPEAIHITASPKDSVVYLRLINLLKYIQYEFDISWAIIGEVYAKNEILKKLKIRYRRITSNIDDPKVLRKKYKFIPVKASFEAVNNIQNLLIAPLYGNNPSFGVRELLQNAVDACNARKLIEQRRNNEYDPKVNISIVLNNGKYYFEIKDNGIGMSEEVLTKYFLKAGASFRNSSIWQKDFIDNSGSTKVQRAGKFGIGALAAFLLGKKISVLTRHIDQEKALTFEAYLNTEQINITESDGDYGSIIKIELKDETIDELKDQIVANPKSTMARYGWYNWYRLSSPALKINIPNDWPEIPEFQLLPGIDDLVGIYSQSFYPAGYNKVIWTYASDIPELLCNGIVIPEGYNPNYRKFPYFPNLPSVSVFDYEGNLPLQLNRAKLDADVIPFSIDLLIEIFKDLIAYALALPVNRITSSRIGFNSDLVNYPGYEGKYVNIYRFPRLIFNQAGYTFSLSECIKKSNIDTIVKIWTKAVDKTINFKNEGVSFIFYHYTLNSINDYKEVLLRSSYYGDKQILDRNIYPKFELVIIKTEKYQFLMEPDNKRLPLYYKNNHGVVEQDSSWTSILLSYSEDDFRLDDKIKNLISQISVDDNSNYISAIIAEKIDKYVKTNNVEDELLLKVIEYYMGDNVVIPYDFEQRKKQYSKAFEELSSNIEKYRNIFKKEVD